MGGYLEDRLIPFPYFTSSLLYEKLPSLIDLVDMYLVEVDNLERTKISPPMVYLDRLSMYLSRYLDFVQSSLICVETRYVCMYVVLYFEAGMAVTRYTRNYA